MHFVSWKHVSKTYIQYNQNSSLSNIVTAQHNQNRKETETTIYGNKRWKRRKRKIKCELNDTTAKSDEPHDYIERSISIHFFSSPTGCLYSSHHSSNWLFKFGITCFKRCIQFNLTSLANKYKIGANSCFFVVIVIVVVVVLLSRGSGRLVYQFHSPNTAKVEFWLCVYLVFFFNFPKI